MISRFEYLYIKSKVKKLENALWGFEIKNEDYKEWDRFLHLNQQEKEELLGKWENYYLTCKDSFWGRAFWSIYPLFKRGEYGNVKKKITAIIEWEKKNKRKSIACLSQLDPTLLQKKITAYYEAKASLEQLKKVLEEYSPVYERKEETLE